MLSDVSQVLLFFMFCHLDAGPLDHDLIIFILTQKAGFLWHLVLIHRPHQSSISLLISYYELKH